MWNPGRNDASREREHVSHRCLTISGEIRAERRSANGIRNQMGGTCFGSAREGEGRSRLSFFELFAAFAGNEA